MRRASAFFTETSSELVREYKRNIIPRKYIRGLTVFIKGKFQTISSLKPLLGI